MIANDSWRKKKKLNKQSPVLLDVIQHLLPGLMSTAYFYTPTIFCSLCSPAHVRTSKLTTRWTTTKTTLKKRSNKHGSRSEHMPTNLDNLFVCWLALHWLCYIGDGSVCSYSDHLYWHGDCSPSEDGRVEDLGVLEGERERHILVIRCQLYSNCFLWLTFKVDHNIDRWTLRTIPKMWSLSNCDQLWPDNIVSRSVFSVGQTIMKQQVWCKLFSDFTRDLEDLRNLGKDNFWG